MIRRIQILAVCALLIACASAPRPAITEISLQRNCFGCPAGTDLILRSNGRVTFTVTGSARHGTMDIVSEGVVSRKDFDALARLIVSRGLFEMHDSYSDPQTQDGKWAIITAIRDGQEKKVMDKNDMAPAAFREIEKAIDAVRAGVSFKPAAR